MTKLGILFSKYDNMSILRDRVKKACKICKQMGKFRRKKETRKWSPIELENLKYRNQDIWMGLSDNWKEKRKQLI